MAVGVGRAAAELATEYAATRVRFGKPRYHDAKIFTIFEGRARSSG
jgi:alkylation response protein AidB-like acyl-CoA dehydrogenase